MPRMDLNADMGEGAGTDAALMPFITSASIACGGHAGNEKTMREALQLARRNLVVAGAHPGFVDPEHFGRRRLDLPPDELAEQIIAQLETLSALAAEEMVQLRYVKLHGALANMAAENRDLALTAFAAVKAHDPSLALLTIDNSEQVKAAQELDMEIVREAYADRAYTRNGLLAPRGSEGAVLTDPEKVVAQCVRLARQGEIVTLEGRVIQSSARSICLHGDTPGAVDLAKRVREALIAEGVVVGAAL